jgi:hypothetical protein
MKKWFNTKKINARGYTFDIKGQRKQIFMEWRIDQVCDNKLVVFKED